MHHIDPFSIYIYHSVRTQVLKSSFWVLGVDTSWSVQKKCGTCFLCHVVCLLPFLPSPSILEAKIDDRVYNIAAFCAGTRLDRGAEECTYGTLGHGVMVSAIEGRKDTVE